MSGNFVRGAGLSLFVYPSKKRDMTLPHRCAPPKLGMSSPSLI
jgi:hypothetical protein